MLIITNGTNIEYTYGDTFEMTVTTEGGFDEGTQLTLVIAQGEQSEPLVSNRYDTDPDGGFTVRLSAEDKAKMPIGEYIYKLTVTDADGTVITHKSGYFTVKWGA